MFSGYGFAFYVHRISCRITISEGSQSIVVTNSESLILFFFRTRTLFMAKYMQKWENDHGLDDIVHHPEAVT